MEPLCIPDIILIGPIGAGKSTVAQLLAQELALPRCCMDDERWPYMEEAGYDKAVERQILAQEHSYREVFRYWKQFEAHMVERLLAEHRGHIIDFGACQSVYEDAADFARVQKTLAPYPNVVLILPSPDLEESVRVVKGRSWDGVAGGFDFQEHFVKHPSNQALAKLIIYTEGKSPEETCREILSKVAAVPTASS